MSRVANRRIGQLLANGTPAHGSNIRGEATGENFSEELRKIMLRSDEGTNKAMREIADISKHIGSQPNFVVYSYDTIIAARWFNGEMHVWWTTPVEYSQTTKRHLNSLGIPKWDLIDVHSAKQTESLGK